MKTSKLKKIIYGIGISLFFSQGFLNIACSDWTDIEAKDYYEPPTQGYENNLKDYFNSPHKIMFGWFGNWAGKGGSSMQYALCGLPDSTDFVSLWLCWGNLTVEQQADLKDFQAKGSRAVLCWRAGDIGDNLTPGGNDDAVKEAFWGFDPKDEQSCIEAAKKYALAIVDTCNKYNIDGFDYDIEDWGTLMNSSMPSVPNAFMKTLREEFDKTGKMLVADIPGGAGWLSFYEVLSEETVLSLDYIAWQTYELGHSGLDSFFEAVRRSHPNVFKEAMGKSIVTATFERAVDKHYFTEQQSYHPACGIEHAGMGAYHIEYDYPGNFIILLFYDTYDVIKRSKDNSALDESEEAYSYFICSICPVSLSKPGLGYNAPREEFEPVEQDWMINDPDIAFLYPSFSDRSADVNTLTYYVKKPLETHPEIAEVLGCNMQKTSVEERECLKDIIKQHVTSTVENADEVVLKVQQNIMDKDNMKDDEGIFDDSVVVEVLEEHNIPESELNRLKADLSEQLSKEIPLSDLYDEKEISKEKQQQREKELLQEITELKGSINDAHQNYEELITKLEKKYPSGSTVSIDEIIATIRS